MTSLLWLLAFALMVVGIVGSVLPVLPGTVLVFAGMLLGAWIDGFTRVPVWIVVVGGVLALLSYVIEYVAALLGARRVGASRLAVLGAAVGTVLGVFTGLIGLLFLPLALAALGEFVARRNMGRAAQVGIATWIGLMLGTIAKVGIGFVMMGLFVAALLI
jgi:uncharacterized protein